MALNVPEPGKKVLLFGGVILGIAVIVGMLLIEARVLSSANVTLAIGLPVLAVSSVILMLGAMSIVSITFAIFGIDDRTQAFGLPDGSIRAVIALSLVVLFGILSVYLYDSMATGHVYRLPADQAAILVSNAPPGQIITDVADPTPSALSAVACPAVSNGGSCTAAASAASSNAPGGGPYHTIFARGPADSASNDFAKQVLTVLGTLVTAIASFYFGSSAVASATSNAAGSGPSPRPQSVSPSKAPSDSGNLTLSIGGSNLGNVNRATMRQGAATVTGGHVLSNDSTVTAIFPIPPKGAVGNWTVTVSANGVDYTVPTALEVTQAANATNGNTTIGGAANGNMTIANLTIGNATIGNVAEGNAADGTVAIDNGGQGNATGGNTTNGDDSNGNATDG